ncbi:hypothetical protein F5X97DRAFT_325156 [Nemania serpens]|nr:hypothetical protein F5X97DRAFT_325156 [Nemania serpens]
MPSAAPISAVDSAEAVLRKTYINPEMLKRYLDAEFDRQLYSVKQAHNNFYILTPQPLTSQQLSEIRDLKITFRKTPEKYEPKAPEESREAEGEVGNSSGSEHGDGKNENQDTTSRRSPTKSNWFRRLTGLGK